MTPDYMYSDTRSVYYCQMCSDKHREFISVMMTDGRNRHLCLGHIDADIWTRVKAYRRYDYRDGSFEEYYDPAYGIPEYTKRKI